MSDPYVVAGLAILGVPPLPDLNALDDHIAAVDGAGTFHEQHATDAAHAYRLAGVNEGPAADAVNASLTGPGGALVHPSDIAGHFAANGGVLRTARQVVEWAAATLGALAVAAGIAFAFFPELLPRLVAMAQRITAMIRAAMQRIGLIFTRLTDRQIAKKVDAVASSFHEDWRASRKLPGGGYEPRPKTTVDQKWIRAHGTDRVDVANTRYRDLPADWQQNNKASADVAVRSIYEGKRQGADVRSPEFIESASKNVHDAWLDRNGELAPLDQRLAYEDLTEEEKAKDRAFVLKALALF